MAKNIVFSIDANRQEQLKTMQNYIGYNESSMKNDKKYFIDHFNVHELDIFAKSEYGDRTNFVIPCEMIDLYCLMTAVMKSSPLYGDKKTNHSLQNIIDHNRTIIDYIERLPPQISDYIKSTSEYYNSLYFVNYMPHVLNRISALLYMSFEAKEIPLKVIFDNLISGLDDVYEQYFWQLLRKESVEQYMTQNRNDFIKVFGEFNISSSNIHLALENVLANLLKQLDRGKWVKGVSDTVMKLLKKWELQFQGGTNKNDKIKMELINWLCNQKWHVLNKVVTNPMPSMFAHDDFIKHSIKEHNEKYDIYSITHPGLIDGSGYDVNARETVGGSVIEKIESEMQQIRTALQNETDYYIVSELISTINNIEDFTIKFNNPLTKNLSGSIYRYIEKLICHNTNGGELLKAYLHSIHDVLYVFDNKYKKFGLMDYVGLILKGDKGLEECCHEIYLEVFLKIQKQKCDKFNMDEHNGLYKDIAGTATGNWLREVLLKDEIKMR